MKMADKKYSLIPFGKVKRSDRNKKWWFVQPHTRVRNNPNDYDIVGQDNGYFMEIRYAKSKSENDRWERHWINEYDYLSGKTDLEVFDLMNCPESAIADAAAYHDKFKLQLEEARAKF